MNNVKNAAQIMGSVVLACVFSSLVSSQEQKASDPGDWPQVFSDDFNRSDVFGPDWAVKGGKWDVRPGNLKANGPSAVIMCTRRFETPFRIEYECYSDNPCDLSIELRKKLDDLAVCFVGFGGENNTLNKIHYGADGSVAVNKDKLIEIGKKHKVAVEAGNDGTIRQIVDDKETLKATIKMFPKKLFFGFYVWNQGVFSSVKVFSPNAGGQEAADKKSPGAVEKIPLVRQFKSFDDHTVGAITDVNVKAQSGEKCSVKIADEPTWLYCFRKYSDQWRYYDENEDPKIPEPNRATVTNHGAHFVSDPCVELLDEGAGEGKHAAITFPVPEMKKGLFEFDLMADHYEGDGLRIMLEDNIGLWINKDGEYYWQAGTNTIKLADRVHLWPSTRGKARFYLQPRRWFTFRIDFDLETSLANVGIVKMFNGDQPDTRPLQTEYIVVGEDLPLPTDAIKELKFETSGTGRFLVDNLFMISRTEDLADDAKWRAAARDIMPAYYPLRKDPIHLKNWSMRNIRCMWGSGCPTGDELYGGDLRDKARCGIILDCAEKYNRIMVRQALLAEKMKGLERAWSYAEKTVSDYHGKVEAARQAAVKAEALLGELYEFYAACYLDRLNQDKMKEGFEPRYAALNAALETADTLIQKTLEEMRAEVLKRSGCKFTPYAIESEDTTSVKAEYSDGAFRRPDGKKDFLFVKANYYIWPAMEKILMFSPVCPLGADHALRDLKEPEYCNNSTNSYFYHILTKRPGEQVALRVFYGLHNHESSLPQWWADKHKNDPDIFLQNSKGKFLVSQQYNYWNPDVLAAQKATLEGLGDMVMKYRQGERISYIDLAQEAYFLSGPGGAWETGYNPSAVKAFQERLKKKYGSIGGLNERWGSNYGNFEEIKPPEDWRVKPERIPGLTYEFELFRQDSWHEWMKQCRAWMSGKMGRDTPSSCQITYNGQTCVDGLDWVKVFETFNIVMEHYSQQFEQEPITYRYLENLREVFKSTTGIGEWYVSGCGDIFNEENIRNNGLRQAYQQVQWGRSVLVYWEDHDFKFLHNGNATENRLGHTVLRYSAAYIPISIARAEAHRAIYLECPLVQADVGILESESSFYNVCGVRGGGYEIASLLFNKGHDYGNLFERLVMDGRQSLKDYKVVVLPNAACLPDKFVEKLLAWVKSGGALVTTGPAGVMNELGMKSGRMLDEVLGAGQWTYEKGKLSVKEAPGLKVLARDSSKQPALIENEYGKGKLCMRLNPVTEDAMYGLISANAPRIFYGEGSKFHMAMRQGKDKTLYLSLLNPDVSETMEDEVVLKGEYKDIADISCNFPILPEIKDGFTRFKVKLGPAEGIMIRIANL